jgi:two-component system phosphate regulon sensor histidine kinase PhoR
MIALGVLAQLATTYMRGMAIEVSTAVAMAAVPLYGPVAAVLVSAVAQITLTLVSLRQDRPGWRRALERLGFNVGMSGAAIFVAGLLFVFLHGWLGDTFPALLVAWLAAGIANDQLNLWLLIGIIYLQHGQRPLDTWRENRWAMPINVAVNSVGGGVLAVAVEQFDLLGVAIFFLPILLSAYAFRLYVNQTREQMEKLEELIKRRTQALTDTNEELSRANAELAHLHREKDAFLAVLSHDMRTPLTSIHGYASLLADHLEEYPPQQRAHMLQVIIRNEKMLLEIVNNILEIQKLQEGGRIFLDRENFDLGALVAECVEAVTTQANEKGVRLECHSQPLFILADKPKIRRVILNLISNAVNYTPTKGRVAVSACQNGQYALVEVRDDGYGIPADELPHVFERYRRVEAHRQKAVGSGLGLAIVKSLVEAHRGNVLVESEVGVGSTFTVQLPL